MSSAVVVPYVVNAETPKTTEATYTVTAENVNYVFSMIFIRQISNLATF